MDSKIEQMIKAEYMTAGEAAEMLGVSIVRIGQMAREHKIGIIRIGHVQLYSRDSVEAEAARRKAAAEREAGATLLELAIAGALICIMTAIAAGLIGPSMHIAHEIAHLMTARLAGR